MIDRVRSRHTLEGLLVDPIEGPFAGGALRRGRAHRRRSSGGRAERRSRSSFPGFVDLQVYDAADAPASGVTGYLLATRTVAGGRPTRSASASTWRGRSSTPRRRGDPGRGADGRRPRRGGRVDRRRTSSSASSRSRRSSRSRSSPIERLAGGGHRRGPRAHAGQRPDDAGRSRRRRHLRHAPLERDEAASARSPGPVLTLLLDERATIGLIPDGRHLHPIVEELAVRVAGPDRIALTSDRVPLPAERPDGSLLGGDRVGAPSSPTWPRLASRRRLRCPASSPRKCWASPTAAGWHRGTAPTSPSSRPSSSLIRTLAAGEDL